MSAKVDIIGILDAKNSEGVILITKFSHERVENCIYEEGE